ncbi:MDR/zinc-dependent alcohol dehydrogenase-like family protein [Kitasatospora viridis]|uniref:Threonine dehydrogenase-like Zn-dependent dehydrogenase n=1 Tax=Kitasatospora viridis TaxID=281105 RepID=A0A561UN04_9ACTN|nr:medium chain dehydrogenase/reductase family protein [Kitasatospora viridis]TWG00727.1 threonine dehydrogenase-like Zn-dependent dehydrogenase [Kitasatospora viridis]
MPTSEALVRDGLDFRVVRREYDAEDGALRARVLRTGICGTDRQIARRIRPDSADVLGHEGLGELTDPTTGQSRHVVFNPVSEDDQDHILGHSYDGLMQHQLTIGPGSLPEAGLLPALPGLPLDLSCLVEPLATAVYAWDIVRTRTAPGRAVVLGAGTAGLLVGLAGAVAGVEVEILHRRAERAEHLRALGLAEGLPLRFGTGSRLPHGGADCAFVCVPREGAQHALETAFELVGPGGVIDLFGGFGPGDRHHRCPGTDLGEVRRRNVCGRPVPPALQPAGPDAGGPLLTGHRGSNAEHLLRAQQLLLEHQEVFAKTITRVVSLQRAAAVMNRIATGAGEGPGEQIKTLVDLTLEGDRERTVDLSDTVPPSAPSKPNENGVEQA